MQHLRRIYHPFNPFAAIAVVIIAIAVLTILFAAVADKQCSNLSTDAGIETRYSLDSGCLINVCGEWVFESDLPYYIDELKGCDQ